MMRSESRARQKNMRSAKRPVRAYGASPIRQWDHWSWTNASPISAFRMSGPGATPRDLLAGSTSLVSQRGYVGRAEDDGTTLEPVWDTRRSRPRLYSRHRPRSVGSGLYPCAACGTSPLLAANRNGRLDGPRAASRAPRFGGLMALCMRSTCARAAIFTTSLRSPSSPSGMDSPSTPEDLTAAVDRSVCQLGDHGTGRSLLPR
jgi:hypothetical protein